MRIAENYKSKEYKQMIDLADKLAPPLSWLIKDASLASDDRGLTNDLINGLEALKRRVAHFGMKQ